MLNKITFTLNPVLESVESFESVETLRNLVIRIQRTQQTQDSDTFARWMRRHVFQSGCTVYIGPYRYTTSVGEASKIMLHIRRSLQMDETLSVGQLLDKIPKLDKTLRKRILTAFERGILDYDDVRWISDTAIQPHVRVPSAWAQTCFRSKLEERHPREDYRYILKTYIEPYIDGAKK